MIEIRQAKKNDTGDITALINSPGPELYDFIYKKADKSPME